MYRKSRPRREGAGLDLDSLMDILSCLVEHEMPLAAIVERGHDPETVRRVERLLYLAEYKRRQAAPGVKISKRAFGSVPE